jgi:hypothetical protein
MTVPQDETPATTWPKLSLPHGLGKNVITAHALARSAIFSTQSYGPFAERPQCFGRTSLPTTGDIKVFQTAGHRLDQGDADVFYELLRRVLTDTRETHREARVYFCRGELLNALGRSLGGNTRKCLDESLDRLFRADFEFSVPKLFVGKSRLILKMHRREQESAGNYDYDVLLDVELARLFGQRQWTILRQSQRKRLEGNPLAKGLHAFYSTQLTPYPMNLVTLKNLMGRESMQNSKWRAVLQTALTKVKQATGWAVCELKLEGRDAGKIVVEREKPADIGPPTPNAEASGSAGDTDHDPYGDI